MNAQGLVDYHTQTLEHGVGKVRRVRETIQAAIQVGLSAICLTDHYPLPPGYVDPTEDRDCAMSQGDYDDYQGEVTEAIAEFGKEIQVLRGAEVDWLPEYSDWTSEQIARHEFDYVLGSVHLLAEVAGPSFGRRNLIIDYTREHFDAGVSHLGGIEALVDAYYREVRALVESGLFDGVGHLDLVKKLGTPEEPLFDESAPWYTSRVRETLNVIAQSGMSIEVNGAGLRKPCHQLYPSPWIILEAKSRGIPLTIGSDAHKPDEVGLNLDHAVAAAKEAGYREIAEYRQRRRIAFPI